jgi:hypothetical protein
MKNLWKKIRYKLIKWLGGYTSLDCIPVEVKRITPKVTVLESCQLFPTKRYEDSEFFRRFAAEATSKSLMGEVMEFINTHSCIDSEYVPELDSIRVRARLKVVEWNE